MKRTTPAVLVATLILASAGRGETAADHLGSLPRPRFAEDHTLPPLTRWGWTLPLPLRVALAEHWGYALSFGPARAAKRLDEPDSVPSRICALASSSPETYPLSVLVPRPLNDDAFVRSLPKSPWCRDADGNLVDGKRVWSPQAPDVVFERAAARALEPLKKVRREAPVAMLLNGGEYALGVYGHDGDHWKQDPEVVAAKGDRRWFDYISRRKAHQEGIITRAVRKAFPDRRLYLYYHTDASPHRNRYSRWWQWAWAYRPMRSVSDIPNSSIYYRQFNSGFTGDNDMLTQALNGVARQIQLGDRLSYNWVNAGWPRKKLGEEAFADLRRYTGYLKCYYTAGMTGGVAGYFSHPDGGFDGDVGRSPPHWLRQMAVLGRVHALFTHLDGFLRDGELLPGPAAHVWSEDLPAYELPTDDDDVRVLARAHTKREAWLVTAWAAAGPSRETTVAVPDLGRVTVEAPPAGAVYRGRLDHGSPTLERVDPVPMRPTRREEDAG